MPYLSAIGHAYSAQARNESISDSCARPAITAENSSLKFTNLGSPINSDVDRLVVYYMGRLVECRGRNTPEKEIKFEAIQKEAGLAIGELISLRNSTFEYIEEGTDNVCGKLKTGKTEGDRDYYIAKLIEFYQVKANIENKEEDSGLKRSNLFELHHSNYLVGDMKALERGGPIPDFYYNSGADQVG